jgi:hypothetical protein
MQMSTIYVSYSKGNIMNELLFSIIELENTTQDHRKRTVHHIHETKQFMRGSKNMCLLLTGSVQCTVLCEMLALASA